MEPVTISNLVNMQKGPANVFGHLNAALEDIFAAYADREVSFRPSARNSSLISPSVGNHLRQK